MSRNSYDMDDSTRNENAGNNNSGSIISSIVRNSCCSSGMEQVS